MKKLGVVAGIVAMLLSAMTLVAPSADAQGAITPPYETGGTCDAGFTDNGPIALGDPWINWYHLCTPTGHNQLVTTASECATAGAPDSRSGHYSARIVNHAGSDMCVWHVWELPATAVPCGGGWIQGQNSVGTQFCLLPVFAQGSAGGAGLQPVTPVCIETDVVQDSPFAAGARVGNTFLDPGGEVFLIITGAPTCSFNCHRGFDANCDDRLGDYCSVELDLRKVADVGTCLEALGI